ncbi:hypothetical protein RKD32_003786 [Streptomyces sp. SAI-195]
MFATALSTTTAHSSVRRTSPRETASGPSPEPGAAVGTAWGAPKR